MRIAIVGYGSQGRAAYEYWRSPENEITVCDANNIADLPPDVKTDLGGDYLLDLHEYDMIVRSPIIHPRQILEANPEHPEVMNRVTTVTNEFFKVCPTKNIIAVTGTKGKGTTSTLISKILEAAGHRVHLGGNIGIPPLDLLKNDIKAEDWVVLELANFQLIDMQYSPAIAVCLMVAPEHLDWHKDMYEYVHAKQQLFAHQTSEHTAVYNARSAFSEEIVGVSHAQKIPYDVPPVDGEPVDNRGVFLDGNHIQAFGHHACSVDDIALLGRHNIENVSAAIAATWEVIGGKAHVIQKAVRSFAGLPHRIEIVGEKQGIWFINDSFASNPEATVAAIRAVIKPKVLIVGGFERGIPLNELIAAIKESKDIRKVVIIGQSGGRVAQELEASGYTNFVKTDVQTMGEVVQAAVAEAQKGDAVVFSPGFASFDMFKNFEDRGIQFKECVSKL